MGLPLSTECKRVILIDPSEKMLENAKKKQIKGRYGKVDYIQQGFLDLSLISSSVDVVIALFGVFQYLLELNEHLEALKRLYDILKPGGFILIDVMNYFSLIQRYHQPKSIQWESKTHIYERKIHHRIMALKEIWIHDTQIKILDKTSKKTEHIKSTHRMKMFSPTELYLLFQLTGFINIQKYPGRNKSGEDLSRIWITAIKPMKSSYN